MGEMIKYHEESTDIIRKVEIDLTQVKDVNRKDLEDRVAKYLEHEGKKVFVFKEDKLIYDTEVLIPRKKKERLNLLIVLGNPAVHSVAAGMFFSYKKTRVEGKWIEHPFWGALRDANILKFCEDIERSTPENISGINALKRNLLLNVEHESCFNVFILPYFSFPTPASGECNGVGGIRKIVGDEIFNEMKKFEFQRLRDILRDNHIRDVICFQKSSVRKEILAWTKWKQNEPVTVDNSSYEVYVINDALGGVTLYTAPPTGFSRMKKSRKIEILKTIIADIKARNKVGG